MTTYYVSEETGNDSNAGTSVGAAWLTFQKAINTATSAGDIIRFDPTSKGYSVFAEALTWASGGSGTAGNEIQFIADINGEYFGNIGYVLITNKTTNWSIIDATVPSAITLSGKDYIKFNNFIFGLAGNNNAVGWNNTGSTDITYTECDFNFSGVYYFGTGYSTASNHLFRDCSFLFTDGGGFDVASEIYDGCEWENCFFAGITNSASGAYVQCSWSSGTIPTFRNCLAIGDVVCSGNTGSNRINIYNCFRWGGAFGNNAVTYNDSYNGVAVGTNGRRTVLFSSVINKNKVDGNFRKFLSGSPLHFSALAKVGVVGDIPTGGDIFGRSYKTSLTGATPLGCSVSGLARKDNSGQMTGNNSVILTGTDFFETYVAVNAGTQPVIQVDCEYDSTYSSNNSAYPRIIVPAQNGSAEKTDTHSGSGAGNVESLSVTLDAMTNDAQILIRVESWGTTAGADAYFDNFAIT